MDSAEGTPLDQARAIIDKVFYQNDSPEVRRNFIEVLISKNLITLLTDSQGRLEGFLLLYRSNNRQVPHSPRGLTVYVDGVWIREDLRGTGTIRKLLRKTLKEQFENVIGASKIATAHDQLFCFKKFMEHYAETEKRRNTANADRPTIDDSQCSEHNRVAGIDTASECTDFGGYSD